MRSMLNRAGQGHNIFLSVLFIIAVVAVLATVFFKSTVISCATFCFGKRIEKVGDEAMYQNQLSYYDCKKCQES